MCLASLFLACHCSKVLSHVLPIFCGDECSCSSCLSGSNINTEADNLSWNILKLRSLSSKCFSWCVQVCVLSEQVFGKPWRISCGSLKIWSVWVWTSHKMSLQAAHRHLARSWMTCYEVIFGFGRWSLFLDIRDNYMTHRLHGVTQKQPEIKLRRALRIPTADVGIVASKVMSNGPIFWYFLITKKAEPYSGPQSNQMLSSVFTLCFNKMILFVCMMCMLPTTNGVDARKNQAVPPPGVANEPGTWNRGRSDDWVHSTTNLFGWWLQLTRKNC